jgi:hypothetical protein
MPSTEDMEQQRQLLQAYRRTLGELLRQQAMFGAAYVPPAIATGIHEARNEIARIKSVLRGWGNTIEDLPNDKELPSVSEHHSLYLVSETPGITCFDPSLEWEAQPATLPDGDQEEHTVYAVDSDQLYNYFFPLACPRVIFYAKPKSLPIDIERLMSGSTTKYVVAIETAWLPQIQRGRLYQYELPSNTFTIKVRTGHYCSPAPVIPRAVRRINNLLDALLTDDVELRVMPSLWKLHDAVKASTLGYSMIRMRFATPRLQSPDEE